MAAQQRPTQRPETKRQAVVLIFGQLESAHCAESARQRLQDSVRTSIGLLEAASSKSASLQDHHRSIMRLSDFCMVKVSLNA